MAEGKSYKKFMQLKDSQVVLYIGWLLHRRRNIFLKAIKEGWAVGQFNVSNLETMRGVVEAAEEMKMPVVIGTSEGESRFIGLRQAVAIVRSFKEDGSIPIILNLDHGRDLSYIKRAIDLGYDMVHYDGSSLPLAENIKNTISIVRYAHSKGVIVEGELGSICGGSEIHKEKIEVSEETLADPDEAKTFAEKTRIDILAVALGSIHGLYENAEKPQPNLKRLTEIKEKVKIPFVLHGGSGIGKSILREAINLGVAKINVNTELRKAFVDSLRYELDNNPEEIKPYKIFPPVIEAVRKIATEKISIFSNK